jgi:hypothetical protein
MWWRSRGRQREGNEVPGKSEQQQKSGGQAMHLLLLSRTPSGLRIEQGWLAAQPRVRN